MTYEFIHSQDINSNTFETPTNIITSSLQDKSFDVDYLLMVAKTMRPTKSVPMKEGVNTQQQTSKKKNGKKKKTKHVAKMREENEVDYTNFEDELYFQVGSNHFRKTQNLLKNVKFGISFVIFYTLAKVSAGKPVNPLY